MRKILLTLLCLIGITALASAATAEVTLDFTKISDFSTWGSSYQSHTVNFDQAEVIFSNANRQTQTIKDCPVQKDGDVTITMNEGYYPIAKVTLNFKQWGTKTQTVKVTGYKVVGATSFTTVEAVSATINGSNTSITYDNVPANVVAVKFSTTESKNQVGVLSAVVEYVTGPQDLTSAEFYFEKDGAKVEEMVYNWEESDPFVAPTLVYPEGIEASEVTYSADPSSIGSVNENTGEVTLTGEVGTMMVTASFIGNEKYNAFETYYMVSVTKDIEIFAIIDGDYSTLYTPEMLASYIFWSGKTYTITFTASNASALKVEDKEGNVIDYASATSDPYSINDSGKFTVNADEKELAEFEFTFKNSTIVPMMEVVGDKLKLGGTNVETITYTISYLGQDVVSGEFGSEGEIQLVESCRVDATFSNPGACVSEFCIINGTPSQVQVEKTVWKRVESLADIDTESEYLIGVVSSDVVMSKSFNKGYGSASAVYDENRSLVMPSNMEEVGIVTLMVSDNTDYPYFIKVGEDFISGNSSSSTDVIKGQSEWAISINDSYEATIKSIKSSPRVIRKNGVNFRNYSATSFEAVVLYKKTVETETVAGMTFAEGPVMPMLDGELKAGGKVIFRTFEGHHLAYRLTAEGGEAPAEAPRRAVVENPELGTWYNTAETTVPHELEYTVPEFEAGKPGVVLEVKSRDAAGNESASFTNTLNHETTGVANVTVDNEAAPAEYYNLQGVRVENPTSGIYIRRQGTRTTKVVLP